MSQDTPQLSDRRRFLKTSSGGVLFAAGGLSSVLQAASPQGGAKPEVLRVGLIGAGGRGTGAALNALRADPNTRLVAIGDAFGDHIDNCLAGLDGHADVKDRVDVPEAFRFTGIDAYQHVIDNCDVVLMASPPYFRPKHIEAAVERGVHMFVEKPVATDAPGLRRVRAACDNAKAKGLSIVSGLCYRYSKAKNETIDRIHAGAIGDIVAMQCTYNTYGLWLRECQHGPDHLEYQLRNWLYFSWLSGDLIAEQHIHSLDKLAWAKGSYPVKATASGGRIIRTGEEYGNVYDHFNTVYEWEDGVRGFSSCRQWNETDADVSDWIFGTNGKAEMQSHKVIPKDGERWRYRSEEPDDMYQQEHDALFAALRAGEVIDDSDHMIGSTMMAMMGRLSAYTGKVVTAEQLWASTEDVSPPSFEFGPNPVPPIARPGVTKFI